MNKLSISDWISFLSGEKSISISNVVSLGAIMLSAFAIIMTTTNNTLWSSITAGVIGVILLIYFYKIGQLYGPRAQKAGELLKKIMLDIERDPLKIEEEWRIFILGKTQQVKKE